MKTLKIEIKSRPSVEAMVKKIFANTDRDVISLEEAFRNWGRNMESEAKNKQWLSNKLPHMKFYNLITPVYALRNNRRILDKLQLTQEGKRITGSPEETLFTSITKPSEIASNGHKKLNLDEFLRAVPQIRTDHPELEINVEVKVKNV